MNGAVVTIKASGGMTLFDRDLITVHFALRHCPECGRLVVWRHGEMDAHKTNGRGANCKTSLPRIRRDA